MTDRDKAILRAIRQLGHEADALSILTALNYPFALSAVYKSVKRLYAGHYIACRSVIEKNRGYQAVKYWHLTPLGEAAIEWTEDKE